MHVERVRDTYPVYDLRYRESFSAAARMAKGLSNLKLLGAPAPIGATNSGHSMKMSLQMGKHLREGTAMAEKDAIFGG